MLNRDKCDFVCDHSTTFVGFTVHSAGDKGQWLQVPRKKIQTLQRLLRTVLQGSSVRARVLARVAGKCVSLSRAVLPGKLLLRNVYRLISQKTSWESLLTLDSHTRQDLLWWLHALPNWNGRPLLQAEVHRQIFTDASGTGWGGWSQGRMVSSLSFPPQQRQRTACSLEDSPKPARHQRSGDPSCFRQHFYCSVHQQTQFSQHSFGTLDEVNSCMVRREGHNACRQAPQWCSEHTGGPPQSSVVLSRVAAEPRGVLTNFAHVGSLSHGQVCQCFYNSSSGVQFPVPGSHNIQCRCLCTGLERGHELVEPTLCSASSCHSQDTTGRSQRDNHRSVLEGSSMVGTTAGHQRIMPILSSAASGLVHTPRGSSRSTQKLPMENLCMERLWQQRLKLKGWSEKIARELTSCRARSTWESYNASMSKFLAQRGCELTTVKENVVAEYVFMLGQTSCRPKGVLCTFSAAFASLQEAIGLDKPLSVDVRKLIQGVQKSRTLLPLQRTSVMLIEPFIKLFKSWSAKYNQLSLEQLRMKAVTLFALTTMLRPLDIAPRSGLIFRRSAISSDEEGGLVIYFHGTKNDSDRDGFRILLRPASDTDICPVATLLQYMTRTVLQAKGCGGPVFVSLRPPFTPLSTTTISHILNSVIILAELDHRVFSAKNFRPTGASTAVTHGMDPAQVQALGRWKSPDTFLKHYVHSTPHKGITDSILNFSSLDTAKRSRLAETLVCSK